MSENKIHIRDTGVPIVLRIRDRDTNAIVDISGALALEMIFWKPSGAVISRTSSLYTDGTDGRMLYTSSWYDFDEIGVWKRQVYVELPTQILHGDIEDMRVYDNLRDYSYSSFSAFLAGA